LSEAPRTRAKARVFAALRVMMALAITAYLAREVYIGWAAIRSVELRASAWDVIAAAVIASVGLLGLPVAFIITLRRAGLLRPGTELFCARVWLQSYYYRYVPGKVMMAAERSRLGLLAGIPVASTIAFVLWEAVLILVSASVVGVATLGLAAGDQPGAMRGYLAVAFVGSLAMLLGFPFVLRILARVPLVQRKLGDLERLRLTFGTQLLIILIYVGVWLCWGAAFFWVARWFVPLPWSAFPDVVFWFVAGYVVGFVSSITPAGLGVREGFLVFGLSGIVPGSTAALIALVGRLWSTLIEGAWVALAQFVPAPSSADGSSAAGELPERANLAQGALSSESESRTSATGDRPNAPP
jgi:hypothetical protein